MVSVFKAEAVVTSNLKHEVFSGGAFLAIENGKILDVGPWKKRPRFRGAKEVDVSFGLITPGLFNMHTHLPMVLLRGIAEDMDFQTWLFKYILPVEKKWVSPEFVRLGAELAAVELIRAGVTFASEMYYFEDVIGSVLDKMGIRVLLGEHVWDEPAFDCPTPEKAFEIIRKNVKKYRNHPRIFPSVNPHAPYTVSQKLYGECVSLAKELDIPLVTHLAETKWEYDEIKKRHRMSPTEYVVRAGVLEAKNVLFAHSIWLDEMDFDLIRFNNVSVALNPQCNAKLASGFPPVDRYLEKGIRFTVGTDGAASNNALDVFSEMNFMAKVFRLQTKNLTALRGADLFDAATRKAAEAVGLQNDLGSLEPGKQADFIVIDLRASHLQPLTDPYAHLIYSVRGGDVDSTYVAGKALMKNRRITVTNENLLRARIQKLWTKIASQIKKI